MRIHIDRERCCSAGMCVATAPALFGQDDIDGRVILLVTPVPEGEETSAREAVSLCPSHAISVAEDWS
ncbi:MULTISPECIES: ferredoxin [Streptomyces]|uniref:ferredoxin n=1 Tax=Streptomyces TaxID=1883 RepID=UPI0022491CAC|nr:ferredoxin [Streptomyces sp. JHD 1]MCX2971658.1 ferredoxin [Streptomyces sp. JHD 1]